MSKKKTTKKLRHDIAKAIDNLPAYVSEQQTQSKHDRSAFLNHKRGDDRKARFLYGAVGTITLLMAAIWFWQANTLFYDFQKERNTAAADTPFTTIADDFDDILETINRENIVEAAELEAASQIEASKDAQLQQAILSAFAATATSSATSTN